MKFKKMFIFIIMTLLFTSCESGFEDMMDEANNAGAGQSGFRVTYSVNGGTGGVAPVDGTGYVTDTEVTVSGNTGNLVGILIRDGIKQRFIGWNTDSGAAVAQYVSGNTFNITEDTILYAIYTTGNDVLRKVGPAGGWVFYDHGSNPGWGRYLEAWVADESGTHRWRTSRTWTNGSSRITSSDIGTGFANTYTHMTGTDHPAAEVVRNPDHGGYTDWFLPSSDELLRMYQNLKQQGAGNFADDTYWSSSEAFGETGTDSLVVFFNTGGWGSSYKDSPWLVRAIRAF